MASYFASDVHLRLDRPERGARFARWVNGLDAADSLTIVGDLCDFWYASRQRDTDPLACDGLRALAAFRSRGGSITILAGNHDGWLGDFYTKALGARFLAEPLEIEVDSFRVHLVHGHRLGARRPWKGWMESRGFLAAFRSIPGPIATALDHLLEHANERRRIRDDERHLAVYRRYAATLRGRADLVVFGHIHTPLVETQTEPRIIVLGGWHYRSSYLKIDGSRAELIVEDATALVSR